MTLTPEELKSPQHIKALIQDPKLHEYLVKSGQIKTNLNMSGLQAETVFQIGDLKDRLRNIFQADSKISEKGHVLAKILIDNLGELVFEEDIYSQIASAELLAKQRHYRYRVIYAKPSKNDPWEDEFSKVVKSLKLPLAARVQLPALNRFSSIYALGLGVSAHIDKMGLISMEYLVEHQQATLNTLSRLTIKDRETSPKFAVSTGLGFYVSAGILDRVYATGNSRNPMYHLRKS